MSYNIQQPAIPNADDKWTAAEHNGSLLIFFPTEVRRGIKTSNGDADAVSCSRVVNLNTGRILHNTLIFGTALVPNIGGGAPDGIVLGRLGQGEGKPGQSKPWILLPHDENDLRMCQDWLARDAQGQVTQPQAQAAPAWGQPAAAPAQAPWGQQNAPQAGWGAPQGQQAPAPDQGQFAGQWGNAAPPQPSTFNPQQAAATGNGWGQPTPSAPVPQVPAGPAPDVDPGLVEALRKKGVAPGQLTSMQQALDIWAVVQHQPDTVQ